MEDTQHIVNLLRKYLREDLTEAENHALQQWADSASEYRQYVDSLTVGHRLPNDLKRFAARWSGGGDALQERLAENVLGRVAPRDQQVHRQPARPRRDAAPRIIRWLPYAAAVILLAIAGTWVFFGDRIGNHDLDLQAETLSGITPGGNRATLRLADGRTIDLSEAQNGIVVGAGITYEDGSPLTALSDELYPDDLEETLQLELSTPKGGTYSVTLPDGSKVHLNAGSRLTYPSRFGAHERLVELEGEAYFEVTGKKGGSDRHIPFKVVSRGQTVEVLGTTFNISGYADEPEVKTTLVEGAVQVVNRQSNVIQKLAPGEQSTVRGAATQVQSVDTDPYTAWVSGKFSFDNKPFDQIMRELGRWYDLEIRYEGPVPQAQLFGDAFRNRDFSFVLELLDNVGVGHRFDGRTLIIKETGKEENH